ncbi:hypothetical protein [Parabacteroides pacaensis]|uniref:hypothetical protein n=1 Tax=Parabacteroides pacaensis TaxID=2086575 RepID=UPI000D103651|nr:hypothetical protein [Parabacteroides pacaensis]
MKAVFYNNWFAKLFLKEGYSTIMFFGLILTKQTKETFSRTTYEHECIHREQFADCAMLGGFLMLIAFFALQWWWAIVLPFTLFYILYLVEWLIKLIIQRDWRRVYRSISFEREAYDLQGEYMRPCAQRRSHRTLGWLKYF